MLNLIRILGKSILFFSEEFGKVVILFFSALRLLLIPPFEVRNTFKQMLEIVNSVLDTVRDIARGAIAGAANMLERAMARAIPVMLGFLANQLGLGDISERIKEVLDWLDRYLGPVE